MRRPIVLLLTVALFVSAASAHAAGKIFKVLPQYLDLQGRASVSPSLYDRDAYQALLLKNPNQRSAVQFKVYWRSASNGPLKIRVEARGSAQDVKKNPNPTWEKSVEHTVLFSRWTTIAVTGDDYKTLGTVTAWHITLWDGDQLLSEQKSFLW